MYKLEKGLVDLINAQRAEAEEFSKLPVWGDIFRKTLNKKCKKTPETPLCCARNHPEQSPHEGASSRGPQHR